MKQLNIMALFGMVINVSLNLILIPRFLAFGSAYASLITQLLTAAAQLVLAIRIFKIKPNYRFIFRLVAFTLITVVLAVFSKNFENWLAGYVFLISVSVLTAFLLKLFNIVTLVKTILTK